ncbi:MAG TPA: protein-L-isoaspartate O-methyltransferase [Thermoplasmatales archaeon]|nr:protein-L-isoaspartate O-methyltransferase [Thermoplasmatales archaeon]HEX08551.1 protein-L-isoaspartate O-methyltransferase [Thermoplasmatales archaeon]
MVGVQEIRYSSERIRLVRELKSERYIRSLEVEKAFLEVPRENFVPDYLKKSAYFDTPLEIGFGQTISAPHMVAIMCECLDLKKGHKVLEIGSGSGYHAAVVSKIIGEKGRVYSVERIKELADIARENIRKTGIKNVEVFVGDGSLGLKKFAPYDRIYVTCAAPDIPEPLIEQLKDPGLLLIPVGRYYCELMLLKKENGKISTKNLGGCAFVPLVGKYGFNL